MAYNGTQTLIENRQKIKFASMLTVGKIPTGVTFSGGVDASSLTTGVFSHDAPGAMPLVFGWVQIPEISDAWAPYWDYSLFTSAEAPSASAVYVDLAVGDDDWEVIVLNLNGSPITVNLVFWLYVL